MKIKLIHTAAVAIGALFTSAAFAHAPTVWDQRDARQNSRIEHGVRSGQITHREAVRLQRGQVRIDRMEHRAMRDGRITARERNRIAHAQDRQGRAIYRQSHDSQTADRGRGPAHNMHGQAHREVNQYRHTGYGNSPTGRR